MQKTKDPCIEILFAGFGGQGIMFMGKLMAQAGLDAGKHVTWMPSYGAEVRGGTAYSMAKISDDEIASPIVDNLDILVAMNKPSMVKYESKIRPKGILIMNKSLIDVKPARKDIETVNIPMTEIASKIGDTRCANMVAMGAIIKKTNIITLKYAAQALKEMLKGKDALIELNKKALETGYRVSR
jgi:2-oxoglutarate ferredoxin oxidoreductase subunit gamma